MFGFHQNQIIPTHLLKAHRRFSGVGLLQRGEWIASLGIVWIL